MCLPAAPLRGLWPLLAPRAWLDRRLPLPAREGSPQHLLHSGLPHPHISPEPLTGLQPQPRTHLPSNAGGRLWPALSWLGQGSGSTGHPWGSWGRHPLGSLNLENGGAWCAQPCPRGDMGVLRCPDPRRRLTGWAELSPLPDVGPQEADKTPGCRLPVIWGLSCYLTSLSLTPTSDP